MMEVFTLQLASIEYKKIYKFDVKGTEWTSYQVLISTMGQNTTLCLLMATLNIAVVRFSGSILIYGDIPGNLFL